MFLKGHKKLAACRASIRIFIFFFFLGGGGGANNVTNITKSPFSEVEFLKVQNSMEAKALEWEWIKLDLFHARHPT